MISIVIPHYDDEALFRKNYPKLAGLLKKSQLEFEVILVDDNSPNFDSSRFNSFENLKVVSKPTREGFGPTVNRGVREAKGEIAFVLKVDVLPEKANYFELILEHFKETQVFAVSSALKSVENGREEIRGQGIIYYYRGFFLHKRGSSSSKELASLSLWRSGQPAGPETSNLISAWADGGSSAYKRDIFIKLGGFDPVFAPYYWEDTDLGYRAWKAGFKVKFEPKAVLLHEHTKGSIARNHSKEYIRLLNLRNQFNFLWCNADLKYLLLYLLWLPYYYGVSIKNLDFFFIKAHLWSKARLVELLLARLRRRSFHRKSDDEVLKIFEEI